MSEENNIVNQSAEQAGSNAESQEPAATEPQTVTEEATTATTNEPVQGTQAETEPVVPQEPVAETIAAHDDFDWSIDKRNVSHYSPEEKAKYDKVYEGTFVTIEDGEIVHGTVVALTKTDAVINIGFKSDGLVSLNEFRDNPNTKVGDIVEVMVVEKEDRDGNLHLSRKQARVFRAW